MCIRDSPELCDSPEPPGKVQTPPGRQCSPVAGLGLGRQDQTRLPTRSLHVYRGRAPGPPVDPLV
eukprot:13712498-Alexandrium_andersonii.AAC.1